jgi:hypothetical protein
MSEGIEGSVNRIRLAMQADHDLAWSWHSNVAVCACDEGVDHRVANMAAARFMKLAFGFDVTKTHYWRYFEIIWNKQGEQNAVSDNSRCSRSDAVQPENCTEADCCRKPEVH